MTLVLQTPTGPLPDPPDEPLWSEEELDNYLTRRPEGGVAGGVTDPVTTPPAKPLLEFLTVKELRAKVVAAGPRRWLLRGFWPAGDYGVFAGDMKAQKSWTITDAVVSVASGTPWLGLIPVDQTGAVLMFAGEGGDADILRRIDAVCIARGVNADDLPITICCRAPHLSNGQHLALMADRLDQIRPVFTSIDPFYLSAGGAKGSDLYAMGELLERPQHLCQEVGSSLAITTHQNRQQGRGAARITGAGPAEWGRVLVSATVKSRRTDRVTAETTVITELDVIGGSIPGGRLQVVRRIFADDPNDLDSPLHYSVKCEQIDDTDTNDADTVRISPAGAKLLDALQHASGDFRTVKALVDWVAQKYGHGLARETCSKNLTILAEMGLCTRRELVKGGAVEWAVTKDGTDKTV